MKIRLELVINPEPDGRRFLNFWDWQHGKDVCCQIKDGRLFLLDYDANDEELPEKEISFSEFISSVESVI